MYCTHTRLLLGVLTTYSSITSCQPAKELLSDALTSSFVCLHRSLLHMRVMTRTWSFDSSGHANKNARVMDS